MGHLGKNAQKGFPLLPFKILFGLGIILPDGADLGTCILLCAVAASGISFGNGTFADLTQIAAVHSLDAVHATSLAVYVFRQDGRIVQLGPELGGLLTQCLVVILCCNVDIAFLAVQSTNSDQLFHINRGITSGIYCPSAPAPSAVSKLRSLSF